MKPRHRMFVLTNPLFFSFFTKIVMIHITKLKIFFFFFEQPEFFQDDLFPDTRVTWQPTLSGDEWLDGESKEIQKLSLQPSGMKKCELYFT